MYSRPNRAAVTLVEMLVVLVILAGLVALLLPAISSARQAARDVTCKNNLRQICIGMKQLIELQGECPQAPPPGCSGGWSVAVLEFLEDNKLSQTIGTNPIRSLPSVAFKRPAIMSCPANSIGLSSDGKIEAGHYAADGGRLLDVPTDFAVPWLSSPTYDASFKQRRGPHNGRYFAGHINDGHVQLVFR